MYLGKDQRNWEYCNDNHAGKVYQNCKFNDPWGRSFLSIEALPCKSYSENAIFVLFFSTLGHKIQC